RKLLGSLMAIAAERVLGHLLPVDLADVQPETDPAARPDVGRQIEPGGIELGQIPVLPQPRLEAGGDDAVPMMIVEEIGKHLFPHPKRGVLPVDLARRLGKAETDLREFDEARVFRSGFGHGSETLSHGWISPGTMRKRGLGSGTLVRRRGSVSGQRVVSFARRCSHSYRSWPLVSSIRQEQTGATMRDSSKL